MKMSSQLVLTVAFTSLAANASNLNTQTETAATNLGAHISSQIGFEQGKSELKAQELAELRQVIGRAKADGKISEIKIISWADRDYPSEGTTAPNQQVKLAAERGDKIKIFIKKELNVNDVEVYNMAKRPNALQELFNTQTAKVKDQMETSGAAPTKKEDTGWFGLKGKTSEALVLVYTDKK